MIIGSIYTEVANIFEIHGHLNPSLGQVSYGQCSNLPGLLTFTLYLFQSVLTQQKKKTIKKKDDITQQLNPFSGFVKKYIYSVLLWLLLECSMKQSEGHLNCESRVLCLRLRYQDQFGDLGQGVEFLNRFLNYKIQIV